MCVRLTQNQWFSGCGNPVQKTVETEQNQSIRNSKTADFPRLNGRCR
jgi:hypothetical protein